ncbi:MAG TPA: hypothetical protein VFW33_18820 [Gemmataceae bacterium]|nr:hypothetical protein [Gemmataceae bacterium]
MASPDNLVLIYKELADVHERQGRPQLRDRYLVLAADAALGADRSAEADLLMARLLRANPHHMLRPFPSFADAMASPDIRNYVAELRRTHPPKQAEAEFDALRTGRAGAAPRQTRALPPTAPVVDLDAEDKREPLKLHREQDGADTPPPARAPKPAAPKPAAPKPAPPKAAPRPITPIPLAREPAPERPPAPVADAEEASRGAWLSATLFVLVLAAGLALAGWTLLRPFLPKL